LPLVKGRTDISDLEIEFNFHKISYDRMLTENMRTYQKEHPNVDMHVAIDITRGYSDRDYLDAIAL
jgi:hypothetical protein